MKTFSLVVALFACVACGDEELTQDQLVREVAELYCDRSFSCGSDTREELLDDYGVYTQGACESALRPEVSGWIEDYCQGTTFQAEYGEACLEALRDLSCDDFFWGDEPWECAAMCD